ADFETHVWSLEPESSPQAALLAAAGVRYASAGREPLVQLGARLGNVDVLYEATGAPQVIFQALEALGHNGVLVLTGLPGGPRPLEIDAGAVMRTLVLRNQVVLGTINAGRDAFQPPLPHLALFHSPPPRPAPP